MARIQDVAKHAGVSPSTVSYVLSGRRTISEKTRERVLRSIDELGYQPNAGASALASSRTQILAVVVPLRPGVDVNVLMQFVAGVATRARHHDHDVLLVTETDTSGIERISQRSMADALIVMDVESHDQRIDTLLSLKQPSVLIGMPDDPRPLTCIDFDFEAAGALAAAHLADRGHRNIALIGAPHEVVGRGTSYAIRTGRGIARETGRRGLGHRVLPCRPEPVAGSEAVAHLVDGSGVTGLIVQNEAALPGVLDALAKREVRVPDDVEVVAIGSRAMLSGQLLPVTIIDLPGVAIGSAAVDMVMELLAGDSLPQRRLVAPQIT